MKPNRTISSGIVLFSIAISIFTFSCKKSSSPAPAPPAPPVVPVQINAIYPQEGIGGTTVTIKGAGFSAMSATDGVFFNGKVAAISFAEDSVLQVTVPMTAGTGNVTVKLNGTTVTGPSFTYDYQGVVSTFAGTAGPGNFMDGTGSGALFNNPKNIAVDASGNLYVADYSNKKIRVITPGEAVTTLVTLNGYIAGLVLDGKGNLFGSLNSPIPGILELNLTTLQGSFISGGVSPGFQNSPPSPYAEFEEPNGVALDANGHIYVADQGNQLIRVITPGTTTSSTVTGTFAGILHQAGAVNATGSTATFNYPAGLAFDGAGNLYVADEQNNMIRKITPDTAVSTVAGSVNFGYSDGLGVAAGFNDPVALAVDSKGNIYVADNGNNVIRMITPAGAVTTIAGSGNVGSTDGTGPGASFNYPSGIACDANGVLWVSDGGNNTIRKIILQ